MAIEVKLAVKVERTTAVVEFTAAVVEATGAAVEIVVGMNKVDETTTGTGVVELALC